MDEMWPHLERTHTSVFFIKKKQGRAWLIFPFLGEKLKFWHERRRYNGVMPKFFRNVNYIYVIQWFPGAELTVLRLDLNCWTTRALYQHLSCLFSLYLFECWEGKGGKRMKRQNKRGIYRERDRTVGTIAVNFLEGEGMWLERAIFWKVTSSSCLICRVRHIKPDIKMMLIPDWAPNNATTLLQ